MVDRSRRWTSTAITRGGRARQLLGSTTLDGWAMGKRGAIPVSTYIHTPAPSAPPTRVPTSFLPPSPPPARPTATGLPMGGAQRPAGPAAQCPPRLPPRLTLVGFSSVMKCSQPCHSGGTADGSCSLQCSPDLANTTQRSRPVAAEGAESKMAPGAGGQRKGRQRQAASELGAAAAQPLAPTHCQLRASHDSCLRGQHSPLRLPICPCACRAASASKRPACC